MKIKILLLSLALLLQSCATVVSGFRKDQCQAKRPDKSNCEPDRAIQPIPFAVDLVFLPVVGLIIDFATGCIYKKCPKPCDPAQGHPKK